MRPSSRSSSERRPRRLNEEEVIKAAEEFAKRMSVEDASGHDWHHVERVRRLALKICEEEGGDRFVVELAAILHDVGIRAEHERGVDHAEEGARIADEFLSELGVPDDVREKVVEAIRHHRYGKKARAPSLEAAILQDADRLDALGAIGIARAFAYGGARGRPIWDPSEPIEEYDPMKVKSTVTHFYEKLLKLPESLNTESAKRIARDRKAFMESFLERFLAEWKGRA